MGLCLERLKDFLALQLAVFASLLLLLPGFYSLFSGEYPPSWKGDVYEHLFRVWKLTNYGWRPWARDWYSGYPFLRYYPPLSFLTAAFLGLAVGGNCVLGYKLTVVLSVALSSASMYALGRTLGLSRKSSIVSGIVYATNPWQLRLLAPWGRIPRAFAISIAPSAIASALLATRSRSFRKAITLSLPLAALVLSHHTVTFITIPPILLFLVLELSAKERKNIFRAITSFLLAVVYAAAIASFWFIPFLKDIEYASFLPEAEMEYIFRFRSVKPTSLYTPHPKGWGYYQGVFRLLMIPLLAPLSLVFRKRHRKTSISLGILFTLSLILGLGVYGPAPWLNKLPLLSYIPPERWIDLLQLIYGLTAGLLVEALERESPSRRSVVLAVVALLILFSWLEALQQQKFWVCENFDGDLAASLRFIGSDKSTGWRFYQWKLGITKESMIGYSTVIAGKPSTDGWYRQGDLLYRVHSELEWALSHDADYAKTILRRLGIKYVIVDENSPESGKAMSILRKIGYRKSYSSGSIHIFKNDNATLLRPSVHYALVISGCPRLVLDSLKLEQRADVGRSALLDDYTDAIKRYRVVILYNYTYRDPISWQNFLDYVRNGGTLIVDTYRTPDALKGIPFIGIKSHIIRLKGSVELKSDIYNTSMFSEFKYDGSEWTGTVYEEVEPLILLNNSAVIGYKQLGSGVIYLVGLNLIYHAVYNNNTYEREILQTLLPPRPEMSYYVELLRWEDGYISFNYRSSSFLEVDIAESWFPYWRVYVNGTLWGAPLRDPVTGTMIVLLPSGEYLVELKFEDPYVPLRYLSAAFVLAVLLNISSSIKRKTDFTAE